MSDAGSATPVEPANTNGVVFWPVAVCVVLADVATKALAVASLDVPGFPHPVVGDALRFTLVRNPGAAFGMHVGPFTRWIFIALTLVVLRVLWTLYRRTRDRDNVRVLALALVIGGAIGNLLDRFRSAEGVVDFIDVGIGATRWPTFNVADIAVTCGAVLLAWVLWGEEEPAPALSPSADAS